MTSCVAVEESRVQQGSQSAPSQKRGRDVSPLSKSEEALSSMPRSKRTRTSTRSTRAVARKVVVDMSVSSEAISQVGQECNVKIQTEHESNTPVDAPDDGIGNEHVSAQLLKVYSTQSKDLSPTAKLEHFNSVFGEDLVQHCLSKELPLEVLYDLTFPLFERNTGDDDDAYDDESHLDEASSDSNSANEHSEDDRFYCQWTNCEQSFAMPWNLELHVENEHVVKWFACPVQSCILELLDLHTLAEHLFEYHRDKIYRCVHVGCTKFYSQRRHLTQHVESAHENIVYECKEPNCNAVYMYESTLAKHVLNKHQGVKHPCPYTKCGRTFTDKGNLNRHVRSVHKGQRHYCRVSGCRRSYTSTQNLSRHQKRDH